MKNDEILAKSPIGIAVIRFDGRYVFVNDAYCKAYGYASGELLGESFLRVVPDHMKSVVQARHEKFLLEGGELKGERNVLCKDGRLRAFLFDSLRTMDETEGPCRLVYVLDISERKEADDQVRRLTRLYAVLSGINEAMLRIRDARELYREACRVAVEVGRFRMAWMGLSASASGEIEPVACVGGGEQYLSGLHVAATDTERGRGPTGRALRERCHVVCNDIASDPVMAPWRDLAAQHGYRASAAFPIAVPGAAGGVFTLYSDTAGVFDEAELQVLDKLAADIGFALEVIESNRARDQSEMRSRTLLEMAPFPIVLLSLDVDTVLYGNRRAQARYGIGEPASRGVPASRYCRAPERHELLLATLRTLGHVEDFELPMATGTGEPFWALVSAQVLEIGGERTVLAALNDVSERRRIEGEIRKLNVELEERVQTRTRELAAANKELRTFAYSVSHDLKAPLRGIDGYSRLLAEDYGARLDDEGRLFLRNIRLGVEQMSALIEDLLAYSQMDWSELRRSRVALADAVAVVLQERKDDIAAKGARVRVELGKLEATVDPSGLAMVLRNLIDNALKFTRGGVPPELSISAQDTPASVILAVADNGVGFDMQYHDRIFEIFQRLQRAEDYPGTGVGLAIVRKAVHRMGGRVWAQSEPGHGTTFYVELPK